MRAGRSTTSATARFTRRATSTSRPISRSSSRRSKWDSTTRRSSGPTTTSRPRPRSRRGKAGTRCPPRAPGAAARFARPSRSAFLAGVLREVRRGGLEPRRDHVGAVIGKLIVHGRRTELGNGLLHDLVAIVIGARRGELRERRLVRHEAIGAERRQRLVELCLDRIARLLCGGGRAHPPEHVGEHDPPGDRAGHDAGARDRRLLLEVLLVLIVHCGTSCGRRPCAAGYAVSAAREHELFVTCGRLRAVPPAAALIPMGGEIRRAARPHGTPPAHDSRAGPLAVIASPSEARAKQSRSGAATRYAARP